MAGEATQFVILERLRFNGKLCELLSYGSVFDRWLAVYERARKRYGVGVAVVRERTCQGCFVTLPTALASRPDGADSPGLCSCCGRVLYWG